jgi:hypothetical protein
VAPTKWFTPASSPEMTAASNVDHEDGSSKAPWVSKRVTIGLEPVALLPAKYT